MFVRAAASLMALAAVAQAHFLLNFPATRGFDEDAEPNFCGGAQTNATGRHVFPLSGSAPVQITSAHEHWQFGIVASSDANPTSFADFNGTGGFNYLLPFVNGNGEGNFCFNVDFSTLSSQLNIRNGSFATLQAIFNGGDGTLYQCSDLILVQNAPIPSNVTCTNSTASSVSLPSATGGPVSASASGSASSAASAPSASTSNSGAVGPLAAGAGALSFATLAGLIAVF